MLLVVPAKVTPRRRVLLEKLIVAWLVKFAAIYGTQRFITMFTRACPEPVKSTFSHHISVRYILIFSHLHFGFKWSLSFRFSIHFAYVSHLSRVCYSPHPHLIILDLITLRPFGEKFIFILALMKV
jgi:hypothetical protein